MLTSKLVKRLLIYTAIASPLAIVSPAALADTYQLEKTHVDLLFSIDHAGFTQKHGSFRDLDATLDYDAAKPEASRVTVTVKTASIDTALPARDKDLKGERFLDVEKYPEMKFVSTRVTSTGAGALRIEGNLTLHGVTKPLTLGSATQQVRSESLRQEADARLQRQRLPQAQRLRNGNGRAHHR